MPIASATDISVIGLKPPMPWVRKPSWRRTISLATLTIVFARWSSERTSQFADCRHSPMKARSPSERPPAVTVAR